MNMGFVKVLIVAIAFAAALPIQSEAGENASPKAAHPAKGKTLFIKHCAGCHGVQGKEMDTNYWGPIPQISRHRRPEKNPTVPCWQPSMRANRTCRPGKAFSPNATFETCWRTFAPCLTDLPIARG
jgi:hypothetical protein